jgi:hypothetical protein
MTFPSGTSINTSNLDSAADNPSLAREDLYNLVVAVNQLIASENSASGVAVLNGSGKLDAARLPTTVSTASLSLQPTSAIVNLNRVLRLQQTVTADLGIATGTDSPQAGDIVFLTDGDAGQPCLSIYDGSGWKVVRLFTAVGDVGGTLTAVASLTATAD